MVRNAGGYFTECKMYVGPARSNDSSHSLKERDDASLRPLIRRNAHMLEETRGEKRRREARTLTALQRRTRQPVGSRQ